MPITFQDLIDADFTEAEINDWLARGGSIQSFAQEHDFKLED